MFPMHRCQLRKSLNFRSNIIDDQEIAHELWFMNGNVYIRYQSTHLKNREVWMIVQLAALLEYWAIMELSMKTYIDLTSM